MDEIENLLEKYVKRFEEDFPIFLVLGMGGEEIRKLLEESLETGKSFRPEVDRGSRLNLLACKGNPKDMLIPELDHERSLNSTE